VRDLALDHEKLARLEIEGADAELDVTVIEQLRDPLSHMIRNAVAHGIEPPDERAARGKDPCGRITLRARHEGASILVQVEDDGAGLDRDRIRTRARTLGLAAESEQLSDAEATELVFSPGFSTAEGATLAAGRGVGMDVVRRNIEALHGSVSVASEPGQGTTISLRLPLTLAIIEGFAVGVGEDTYVLPLSGVIECFDLPRQETRRAGAARLINLRGKSLPYVPLRAVLGGGEAAEQRQKIVVIRHAGEDAGIAVDRLYGERQVVIKPLSRLFRDLPGIAGATILGDGRVALILDVPALLERAVGRQGGEEGQRARTGGPLDAPGSMPPALPSKRAPQPRG
jgi:two-component system chemotaxis sensor kinase CheA